LFLGWSANRLTALIGINDLKSPRLILDAVGGGFGHG
jgi:hypothetical protein